ncbi:MAG TPA: cupin-like domain-containing protein [Polyangiaceae bacterium]|nr:cupin-like domain-containing protein [Polyangiaceae bacterium]
MRVVREVERAPLLSRAAFEERFEKLDRPVVIAGGAAAWRATATWSGALLRERLGATTIHYKQSSTHQHPDFHQATLGAMFARGSSSFTEFLDAIEHGPADARARRVFTGDEQFVLQRRDGVTRDNPALSPLYRDVEIPPFFAPERLYTVWAWFSGAGPRTWLHYDNNGCHNLNGQVLGRKECWLFEPDELERLYPFPLGEKNPAHNCCAVDVEAPDLARHPRFADARAEHAVLERGDLLFIPAWWIHTFSHLGELNANVNFWWKPATERDNAVTRWQHEIARDAAKKA